MEFGAGAIRRSGLAMCATVAYAFTSLDASAAIPPNVSGTAQLQVPEAGAQDIIVNLRQLGVVSGSAPVRIEVESLELLVDGESYAEFGLIAQPLDTGPGSVCVQISNGNFRPEGPVNYSLRLSVSSLSSSEPTPAQIIPITNTPGPTVDPETGFAACSDPNSSPIANAGTNRTIVDAEGDGEAIVLDGSASSDPDPGTVLTYVWSGEGMESVTSANPVFTTSVLPPGTYTFSLTVIDDSGDEDTNQSDPASVTITIEAADAPTANAGGDRTIADTDGVAGEDVALDASASDAGEGATYEWFNAQEQLIATGITANVRLPDGENLITLVVTSADGVASSATVTILVTAPPQAPIANAGPDQNIADSDGEAGEDVTLDGSASADPEGQPLSYEWLLQSDPVVTLGTGATLSTRLPDGTNTIVLRVEDPDGNVGTDTVIVTVGAARERISLADLPNLTPNKRSVAMALDRICVQLDELSTSEAELTAEQEALLARCNGLYFGNTAANQANALGELGAEDFAAARTQTLLFSNTLYASVMDRLVALRGGARGLSLAGLNIVVDGKFVPLAQVQEMFKGLLGGGASSDADAPGGLFGDKLGVWVRGNYSFGEKDDSAASPRFDADQWALMGGIDYRLSEQAVVGVSLAYGQAAMDFDPRRDAGSLDTTSWAASLYGSSYAAKNFYFDAIVNVASADYDAERNITYVDGSGLVDADARGTTDGITLSGGISAGYDFLLGGLTLSPTLGAFYIDATIDGFTEQGAAGLNLIYDEQSFTSLTGTLGLRATYAWNASWGVLLPHVRIDYVREFEDDVDVYGVRFAADPNANSAPPILVETDNPDRSYWRLAIGLSAQFAHGISGYVEYQRLESFEYISFQDVSVGLRMQKSF